MENNHDLSALAKTESNVPEQDPQKRVQSTPKKRLKRQQVEETFHTAQAVNPRHSEFTMDNNSTFEHLVRPLYRQAPQMPGVAANLPPRTLASLPTNAITETGASLGASPRYLGAGLMDYNVPTTSRWQSEGLILAHVFHCPKCGFVQEWWAKESSIRP